MMRDNILINDTVKVFENGVEEIKKLKSAIIKLNDTVGELTNFNEILDLEIDSSKIEDVNVKLDKIVDKHKETLDSFEDCISLINEENKIKTDNIKLGINKFLEEVEETSKKLESINLDINEYITNKLKGINDFINDVENKYKTISEKYEAIESLGIKSDNLLETVENINKNIENADIDKKIEDSLNRVTELDLKYQSIIKTIETFDHTINTFDENLNNTIKSIENSNITVKSEEILDDFNKFKDNIKEEYETIKLRYNDINLLHEKIDKGIDNVNSKGEHIFLKLEENLEKDVTNREVIEEIKKSNISAMEEKIKLLENKIDSLIDENKALKLAYATRDIEDTEFKKEIVNLIQDTMSKNYIPSVNNSTLSKSQSTNIERLKELAKQGNVESSFILANKYYKGEDVNKSIELAIRYYMIGAKDNHIPSKNEIIKIYEEEASKGSAKYQRMLGMEYLKGDLVTENLDEAIKWLSMASENGSQEAKNKLNKIKNQ
jgi:hypothetical protein